MGGELKSSQTQQSQTAPWEYAQPMLQSAVFNQKPPEPPVGMAWDLNGNLVRLGAK